MEYFREEVTVKAANETIINTHLISEDIILDNLLGVQITFYNSSRQICWDSIGNLRSLCKQNLAMLEVEF